jgi:membrane protease YdiL (CAAX protease family)
MSRPRPRTIELAATGALAACNVVLSRPLPRGAEVPASAAAAVGLSLLARAAGVTMEEQGLATKTIPDGIRTGLLLGAPLSLAMAAGTLVPAARQLYEDYPVEGEAAGDLAYHVIVRIPISTAAAEEVLFRGALEGLFRQRRSPLSAALITTALFGLWHILPTLRQHRLATGAAGSRAGVGRHVVLRVAATASAGLLLSWLRHRTGSVIAPAIVHSAVNGGGYVGAWITARRDDELGGE